MLRQISLQDSIVYGPIQSRRLGSSLGINLLPTSYKLCSSNCVYCQYGWTEPDAKTPEPVRRAPELLEQMNEEFQAIAGRGVTVDCITLAGNGEPTLHPDLDAIVAGTKQLRDRWFPKAKVGILSDSTQLHRPRVFQALAALDERYMKLDAGDEATWRRINLPLGGAEWPVMIDALKRLPQIVIQAMFVHGSHDNTEPAHIDRWVRLVGEIKPLSAQVYTVDRAPADGGIVKVPRARLQAIADQLTAATGVPADVFA